ncbi:major facilitator superfamily domain-containing protein 9 isoform X1 [Hypanus sabinus]|uniref:major facilitator superfamily domain-containing protein 9 isoform X1 n=1 Tax=Hypanus sabinus TaxID=79690 RepID=UPI0028C46945|nr:major facilitator superfamily domain-containing protein 9 isoform X1 [Hypanus sabinus]
MQAECRRRSRSPGRLPLIPCVYLVGFLDLFGVSLVVPLLSRHIKLLGGSSTVAGLIGSLYGLLQLFSSLLIGSWSDVVGRQSILLVTLILSGFSYGLLGFSSNICLVTLARIPTGIFKHTQTILKALLSDLVPGYKRPHVIGRFCAASSVGFILGPILSGYLVELDGGFYITCFICCFIFLLNAGVVCWLPYKERLYIPTKELHLRTETSCESTCTSLGKEDNRKLLDTASNGVAKHKASDPFWSQCISVGLKIKGLVCSNLWDVFLHPHLLHYGSLLFCYIHSGRCTVHNFTRVFNCYWPYVHHCCGTEQDREAGQRHADGSWTVSDCGCSHTCPVALWTCSGGERMWSTDARGSLGFAGYFTYDFYSLKVLQNHRG